jgi:DNA-binding IclR family transcriptional regulator
MPFSTPLDKWLQRIRSEFQEVPARRVTLGQAKVLWNLEPRKLELILETFVDVGFLRRSPDGSYFHPQPRCVITDLKGLDRLQHRTAADPLIRHG